MDITELYRHSSGLVSFSNGAQWILNAAEGRVIIRRADTFQIERVWLVDASPSATHAFFAGSNGSKLHSPPSGQTASAQSHADAAITHIGWSPDSEHVLAACARRGVVNVYKIRDEDWRGRIETGVEGLARVEWAPDGRHILCFSEWGLRVTVWSLVTGGAMHIPFPKYPDKGYAFRHDGRYFVLSERYKSKDMLGVYDTADFYKQARHFSVPTSSLASLAVSPSGKHVAVWEGPLEYKLCILTLTGTLLRTYTPDPDPGLGIRCVAWHPSGSFIAIGGYDDKIRILEGLTWSCISTLELSARVPADVMLWREPANWIEATHRRGFLSYERPQGPQTVPVIRADPAKPHPKSGLIQLEWNKTGNLLLARFETSPTTLFVYSFPEPSERFNPRLRSVLVHAKPVIHARWNPVRHGALVLCCNSGGFYIWSNEWASNSTDEEVAECVGIPTKDQQMHIQDVQWAPDGKGILLIDKHVFCCAFEVENDEPADTEQ